MVVDDSFDLIMPSDIVTSFSGRLCGVVESNAFSDNSRSIIVRRRLLPLGRDPETNVLPQSRFSDAVDDPQVFQPSSVVSRTVNQVRDNLFRSPSVEKERDKPVSCLPGVMSR